MLTGLLSFDRPKRLRPVADDDEVRDLAFLRLIRSRRVGPATFHRLMAEHGSADAALDALPRIAAATGVRDYAPCAQAAAEAELRAGRRAGARLIRCDHADYPDLLRDIDDAPPVIWVSGDPRCLARPRIALVGARNASSLGLRMAAGMSRALAETGLVVTAGLARGIDTAAHEAACAPGTIAVMAGGIDVIYPAENAKLADRIRETGALMSEQPPGTQPMARHFTLRNRIISGLAGGVVVVEAAHRSGSLITARQALDQGREVMAVPGHPMDARASGCNALIRDGATLVRNADDVIAALENAPVRELGDGRGDAVPDEPEARAETRTAARAGARVVAHMMTAPVVGQDGGPMRVTSADASTGSTASGTAFHVTGGTGEHGADIAPSHTANSTDRACGAPAPLRTGPIAAQAAQREPQPGGPARGPQPYPNDTSDQTRLRQAALDHARATRPGPSPATGGPVAVETRILGLLGPSPTDENLLIRDLGLTPAAVGAAILNLELAGRVIRVPGGRVALT